MIRTMMTLFTAATFSIAGASAMAAPRITHHASKTVVVAHAEGTTPAADTTPAPEAKAEKAEKKGGKKADKKADKSGEKKMVNKSKAKAAPAPATDAPAPAPAAEKIAQ